MTARIKIYIYSSDKVCGKSMGSFALLRMTTVLESLDGERSGAKARVAPLLSPFLKPDALSF